MKFVLYQIRKYFLEYIPSHIDAVAYLPEMSFWSYYADYIWLWDSLFLVTDRITFFHHVWNMTTLTCNLVKRAVSGMGTKVLTVMWIYERLCLRECGQKISVVISKKIQLCSSIPNLDVFLCQIMPWVWDLKSEMMLEKCICSISELQV